MSAASRLSGALRLRDQLLYVWRPRSIKRGTVSRSTKLRKECSGIATNQAASSSREPLATSLLTFSERYSLQRFWER